MLLDSPPKFRFAPSPNGALHLGHAYSAMLNQQMAKQLGADLLLRIEDIDRQRCTQQLEGNMLKDLKWLGFDWEGTPHRQSEHFENYANALDKLHAMGLVYPSFMTRSQIRVACAGKANWPADPDGSPHYPGIEREWSEKRARQEQSMNPHFTLRLNMERALIEVRHQLTWEEFDADLSPQMMHKQADPSQWGDVVLARFDTPTSYHLSVVVDDAEQAITHGVRGQDLYHATSINRLLQALLNLPAPLYHHHKLILDENGNKLSKSSQSTSIQALRALGRTPEEIKTLIGL